MPIDFTSEIDMSTARSGGSGGQNVNKVETMVEGRWNVAESQKIDENQKQIIFQKLSNKITNKGILLVKSQTTRSQLENKIEVLLKINALINTALIQKKSRIATRASKSAKEKRLNTKKKNSAIKAQRGKINKNNVMD